MLKIKNVSGSAGHQPPKYRTWIQYYRSQYKIKHKLTCSYYYCNRQDVHGAHVNKYLLNITISNIFYPKTYIIPLCPKHNNPNFKQAFYIKNNTKLLECNYIDYSYIIYKYLIMVLIITGIVHYIKSKLF